MEIRVKLNKSQLDIVSLRNTSWVQNNDFIYWIKAEIEDWLEDNDIQFSFIYERSIGTTEQTEEITRRIVKFWNWLEFNNPQDAMLFRLRWS